MKRQSYKKPEINRTRKALIWAFMIGFWLFFYWYQTPEKTPKASSKTVREMSDLK